MLHVVRTTSALGILTPGLVAQEHAHSGVASAVEENAATPWTPRFFNSEQNETLIVLGERLIPGSAAAFCNRLIDAVLLIDSDKNKTAFQHSLAAFDSEAQLRHRLPFRDLRAAQQDEILSAASQDGVQLHQPFETTKEWMADAYWTSHTGLRELGWTGRVAWANFPDCGNPHPHN